MMSFLSVYTSLLDQILIFSLLAMSQCIVLRAGVFSIGTPAFAGIGAYATAILITAQGWPPVLAIGAGFLLATLIAAVMVFAMGHLRGVFQAVATLALVQVVVTVALGWDAVTRGALGINGIPKVATTGWLLLAVALTVALLWTIGRYGIGRAFEVIREDEMVAVSLGVRVAHYQRIAMILSGGLAGLGGSLYACNSHAISPEEFGFSMVVLVLTMAVLGGQKSVWGGIVGAAVMALLPELFRVFADYRNVVQGAILILAIIFLPRGIVDSLVGWAQDLRVRRGLMGLGANGKEAGK